MVRMIGADVISKPFTTIRGVELSISTLVGVIMYPTQGASLPMVLRRPSSAKEPLATAARMGPGGVALSGKRS